MRFKQSFADYAIRFVECLKHGDDFYGQPFLLLDWQKNAVGTFYGTLRDDADYRQYQYLYLEIPKKNGKSELAAALGLFHTFADEATYGEVYLVAADKGNAGIIFSAALSMLKQCPALLDRAKVRESTKEIVDTDSHTKMKVMSSEAYSKHGYKPTCVIFDELHAQPNRELWDIMTFGAGSARKQPVWIVLTTAGDDPDRGSIGWEIHEKARRILDYRAGNTDGENYDNPLWLPYIYGMPDDPEQCASIDIFDENLWSRCNPSLGVTIPIETLRNEALDARQSPSAERLFRWLRLNQWIAVKTAGWLPLPVYDAAEMVIPREELEGKRCYFGLDLSSTTDLTALCCLFPPQEGLDFWYLTFEAWAPADSLRERSRRDHIDAEGWAHSGALTATPGDCVDYDFVETRIIEQAKRTRLRLLGTDQWNSRMLTQRLMAAGIEVAEIQQSMSGMSGAMKALERLFRRGELRHERNPCARWCFGNVRCAVDGNENIKPMKNKSTGRIDVAVATVNAMAAAIIAGEDEDKSAVILSEGWGL
ncbi:terminase large subunit [Yanshouia hominis]|uniref:Terminase large subunit n=1 Tax=Yanshouia hominis TaxID=2763673 RepID=A0ABR7NHG0_9FIRM|nr:terminase TerL endonuclease subunit [Yanshouia hominis]MBC8575838.1 terminase large subunit [Yanshouia hominis]DAY45638.1 MAG TPA: Large Terminase [Caudoviricetes sp.]